jgi:hypothetical protein
MLYFYYYCKINPFYYPYILSNNSIAFGFHSLPSDRSEEDHFYYLHSCNLFFSQSQHANIQIHQNIYTYLLVRTIS